MLIRREQCTQQFVPLHSLHFFSTIDNYRAISNLVVSCLLKAKIEAAKNKAL